MAMTTWTMHNLGTTQNHAVHRLQSGNGADWPRRYSKLETSANFPAFLPACLLLAAGRTVACVPAGGIHWLARLYFFLFPTAGPSLWPNSRRKRYAKNRTVEPRCPPLHRKSAPQNAPRDAQSALEQIVRGFVGGGMGFDIGVTYERDLGLVNSSA